MDPHRLARNFINKHCKDTQGRTTLVHWRGDFWRFENGRYYRITQAEVSAQLTNAIKHHVDSVPLIDHLGRVYRVTNGLVSNVANALAAERHIPNSTEQPCWINGESGHTNYIAMKNG